jgi:hypothetical protein
VRVQVLDDLLVVGQELVGVRHSNLPWLGLNASG